MLLARAGGTVTAPAEAALVGRAVAAVGRLGHRDPAVIVLHAQVSRAQPDPSAGRPRHDEREPGWWQRQLEAWRRRDPAAVEALREFLERAEARERQGNALRARVEPSPPPAPVPRQSAPAPATGPIINQRAHGDHINMTGTGDVFSYYIREFNVTSSGELWNGSSLAPIGALPEVRGRDELLRELLVEVRAPSGHPWVLHGLGGAGKSTVAMELARQAQAEGIDVYWVEALDIDRGMADVARRLGVDPTALLLGRATGLSLPEAIWGRLAAAERPWLLVFDNADDPNDPKGLGSPASGTGWFRASERGMVLATTRRADPAAWGPASVLRPVPILPAQDGGRILLDHAPEGGSEEQARALADRLGGLPLPCCSPGGTSTTRAGASATSTPTARPSTPSSATLSTTPPTSAGQRTSVSPGGGSPRRGTCRPGCWSTPASPRPAGSWRCSPPSARRTRSRRRWST
ncbi:AAA family ATPase [Dactylosporangium darangshiense]|uniref:AAA family ATPase n=1 Tax=Dactylosporangium darangshiense TaxID=579108 RepID=UPI0036413899